MSKTVPLNGYNGPAFTSFTIIDPCSIIAGGNLNSNNGQLFNLLTVIPTSKGNFLLLQCFYILDNSISSKQFS